MDGSRDHNEDYLKVFNDGDRWIFALADGLGGGSHGELASRTAVESISDARDLSGGGLLERIFCGAQEAVLEQQKQTPEAADMSTTLVVLTLEGKTAHWAHIGDSRLYRFHGWFLKEQTLDHSVPQMLVNMGELTPSQIRHHEDRSRLLRVIGRGGERPDYEESAEYSLKKGDSFLLCTDGFWEYITEREMLRCLRRSSTAQDWLERMEEIVLENAKETQMDNYSAICVRVN